MSLHHVETVRMKGVGKRPPFEVVPMRTEHVRGAVVLQRHCFPEPFPEALLWNERHLSRHLELFQLGQFVAIGEGEVVASCSNCIVCESGWLAHKSWAETVGGPFIERHDPEGTTLYGLDVSVHPDWRGLGVMRALYEARFALVARLGSTSNVVRYGTAVRIPDYARFRVENPTATPEDYVRAVAAGDAVDRTLTPMLRVGLRLKGVIREYMQDEESQNAAAVLEWRM